MGPLIPFLVLAPPRPAAIVDAAIAAHTAQSKGRATIVRTRDKDSVTVNLDWQRPSRALLRFTAGKASQTVYLNGSTMVAYDGRVQEWIQRGPLRESGLRQRIVAGAGEFEFPAQLLLDPSEMRKFLLPMKKESWKVAETQAEHQLTLSSKGASVNLRFSRKTALLLGAEWRAPKNRQIWQIQYLAPRAFSFTPPASAIRVASFAPPIEMPVFANKESQTAIQRMVRAYRGFRTGIIAVSSDEEGLTRLVNGGGRFKQTGPGPKWAFDGSILTYAKGQKVERVKVKRADLVDKLVSLDVPIEPFLRSLVVRQMPFQELLGKSVTASTAGQVSVGGSLCTIVTLKRPRSRSTLFIRQDGFVQSLSTETLDPKGELLTSTTKRYVYAPLSSSETFILR